MKHSISSIFMMPLIGRHPDEIPFFHDVFTRKIVKTPTSRLVVLTETGISTWHGDKNNECHDILRQYLSKIPTYGYKSQPHSQDSKYHEWEFMCKTDLHMDFDKLLKGQFHKVGSNYIRAFKAIYPDYDYAEIASSVLDKLKKKHAHA